MLGDEFHEFRCGVGDQAKRAFPEDFGCYPGVVGEIPDLNIGATSMIDTV
jgi:hypothetical protein